MPGHATRRAAARTNASIALSTRKCLPCVPSALATSPVRLRCLEDCLQSTAASRGVKHECPRRPLPAELWRHAGASSESRIRQERNRSYGLVNTKLHLLQRPLLESSSGLLRRTPCHSTARSRWPLRNFLCQLAGRINRLDQWPTSQ